jgi:hypothetical protein
MAGKPIDIESDDEGKLPSYMEHGECLRPKMEIGATEVIYPSLSGYLGMTDFNLGPTPNFDYILAESSYTPASVRRTSQAT